MIRRSLCCFLVLLTYLNIEASVIDRLKRQTVVRTDAKTSGQGDDVETSASAHHFKNAEGVGMNISSSGNSSGADQSAVQNSATGQLGGTVLNAQGDVKSQGQHANSFSDIYAGVQGENKTIASYQQADGSGVGLSSAQANGQAVMEQDGVASNHSSDKNTVDAAGFGSIGSKSSVFSNQALTWDQLLTQMGAAVVAEGLGKASANAGMGAGNVDNGVEAIGFVSGKQAGNGNVNAQFNGNANMTGSDHNMLGNMYGTVDGTKGNSSMMGATQLNSNSTHGQSSMSSFGDTRIGTDGKSSIDMAAGTGLNSMTGANGEILMNGTAEGKKHETTVENGLRVKDLNGETVAMGNGQIKGEGTENSNASITVDTKYNQNGEAQIIANGDGQAVSHEKNSTLNINAGAQLNNTNGIYYGGLANSQGMVSGEYNNLTGNSFLNIDGQGSNGNAMMDARGGGVGNSSAQTNTALQLNEGGVIRNATVDGNVAAMGDSTKVHSQTFIADFKGAQSLSNYQQATSNSKGSSSVSASNSGNLNRKKRSNLGVLYDHLF